MTMSRKQIADTIRLLRIRIKECLVPLNAYHTVISDLLANQPLKPYRGKFHKKIIVTGDDIPLRNPAYDGPMGIFEGYGDYDSPSLLAQ